MLEKGLENDDATHNVLFQKLKLEKKLKITSHFKILLA